MAELPPFYKGGIYMLKINEENFPDKSFREYISNTFDYDRDGMLSDEEVSNVQEIHVSYERDMKSLKGIEYFPNLQVLSCFRTGISSLDVSKNPELTYLDCSDTGIINLNITNNSKLETLDCSNNRISELDISKNTILKYLYCATTGITSLDISHNMKLQELNCSNTRITSLDLRYNLVLKELDCWNTGIESLDVSKNPILTSLDCGDTGITELDIRNNPKLKVIYNQEIYFIKSELKKISVQKFICEAKEILNNKKDVAKEVKAKEMER